MTPQFHVLNVLLLPPVLLVQLGLMFLELLMALQETFRKRAEGEPPHTLRPFWIMVLCHACILFSLAYFFDDLLPALYWFCGAWIIILYFPFCYYNPANR